MRRTNPTYEGEGHWYDAKPPNPWSAEAVRRSARGVLRETAVPQVLHDHGYEQDCVDGCTVLELIRLGAGEQLVSYDQGRARTVATG